MKKENFLRKLEDALELEANSLTIDTNLTDLEEYDSLSVLSLIAMIDEELQVKIQGAKFQSVTTVTSLMKLIGEDHFE